MLYIISKIYFEIITFEEMNRVRTENRMGKSYPKKRYNPINRLRRDDNIMEGQYAGWYRSE